MERSVENGKAMAPAQDRTGFVSKLLEVSPVGTEDFKRRFGAVAMAALGTGSSLARCGADSLKVALYNCARLGMVPGKPEEHCYIIPYGNEATLVIGYKGLIALAQRSPKFGHCMASEVYANDSFKSNRGSGKPPEHALWWERGKGEPGEIVAFYCAAWDTDGKFIGCETMHVSEVRAIQGRSAAGKSGRSPWTTDFAMMGRKTVIKRAAKVWPLTYELAAALQVDDEADIGAPQRKIVENDASGDLPDGSASNAGPVEGEVVDRAPEKPAGPHEALISDYMARLNCQRPRAISNLNALCKQHEGIDVFLALPAEGVPAFSRRVMAGLTAEQAA